MDSAKAAQHCADIRAATVGDLNDVRGRFPPSWRRGHSGGGQSRQLSRCVFYVFFTDVIVGPDSPSLAAEMPDAGSGMPDAGSRVPKIPDAGSSGRCWFDYRMG